MRTDTGVLSLGGPQQRRILAVLVASRGQVVSIDGLIHVLWPDGDEPNNARHSAITYVSRLRMAIGASRVSTTTAGCSFDVDGVSIDADHFVGLVQQARSVPCARAIGLLDEALVLWRGPAFGDLGGEWWARPAVSKLDELRVEALVARIEALTSVGWDGHALGDACSLVHLCVEPSNAHPADLDLIVALHRADHRYVTL